MCLTRAERNSLSFHCTVFPQRSPRHASDDDVIKRSMTQSCNADGLDFFLLVLEPESGIPRFSHVFDAAAATRPNSSSVLMFSANSISISTAWAAAARSVPPDWSVSDSALADMSTLRCSNGAAVASIHTRSCVRQDLFVGSITLRQFVCIGLCDVTVSWFIMFPNFPAAAGHWKTSCLSLIHI